MTETDPRDRPLALLTGATGFVGRSLLPALLGAGMRVRVFTRNPARLGPLGEHVEVVQGDVLQPDTLGPALADCNTAYYLVHSMTGSGSEEEFAKNDRRGAHNFARAAAAAGVNRIVYLGGLGGNGSSTDAHELSTHLASRIEVGAMFLGDQVPATVFGAAMIIGRGGASFEMLRRLVERLPVMVTPIWLETRIQPIALQDVVSYLVEAPAVDDAVGSFDIGGPDILSYHQMMERFAKIASIRSPLIVRVPVLTPRLSALWVDVVTRLPPSLTHPLLEGMRNELIADTTRVVAVLPMRLATFDQAVRDALSDTRGG